MTENGGWQKVTADKRLIGYIGERPTSLGRHPIFEVRASSKSDCFSRGIPFLRQNLTNRTISLRFTRLGKGPHHHPQMRNQHHGRTPAGPR